MWRAEMGAMLIAVEGVGLGADPSWEPERPSVMS